jgi:hypothetical protein
MGEWAHYSINCVERTFKQGEHIIIVEYQDDGFEQGALRYKGVYYGINRACRPDNANYCNKELNKSECPGFISLVLKDGTPLYFCGDVEEGEFDCIVEICRLDYPTDYDALSSSLPVIKSILI